MRVAVKCAYDGRNYHGFARQPAVKTIEGALIDVLIDFKYISDPKSSLFQSASRTDKGVSALGNIISFTTEKTCENLLNECTMNLESIILYGIQGVDEGFNPRYARQRKYRYFIHNGSYDVQSIQRTASLFQGTHNFSNFARIETHRNPVRTIDMVTTHRRGGCIIVDFSAQTYLWHQIRRIISAILRVEDQKTSRDKIIQCLKEPDENKDFGLAPSEPLILMDVLYDFDFNYEESLLRKKNELEKTLINDLNVFLGESPVRKDETDDDP
jgi:tRNA pseudouridine38-40 synthase